MVEKLKPINVAPAVHREMKALAATKGTTLAQEAEDALRQHLKREQKKATRQ